LAPLLGCVLASLILNPASPQWLSFLKWAEDSNSLSLFTAAKESSTHAPQPASAFFESTVGHDDDDDDDDDDDTSLVSMSVYYRQVYD
jgi:hypothetical protein